MGYTYVCVVYDNNRILDEVVEDTTTLIADLQIPSFLCLKKDKKRCYVSVSLLLRSGDPGVLAQSIGDFVSTLTDYQYNIFSAILPKKETTTQRFESRLGVYSVSSLTDISMSTTNIWTPDVRDDIYKKSQLSDLVLSSPQRNFANTVVSVNGVLHRTITYNNEAYVIDGFANMRNTKKHQVCVLDTTSLGGHSVIDITSDMIKNPEDLSLTRAVYVDTGVSLKDKTVLLVFNGHMYALDNTYRKVSDTTIKIDTTRIDYVKDYLHNPMTPFLHDYSGRLLRHPYADMGADDMPSIKSTLESYVMYLQNPIEGGLPTYTYEGVPYTYRPSDQPYVLPLFQRMNFSSIQNAFQGDLTALSAFVKTWLSPMTQQQKMEFIIRQEWAKDINIINENDVLSVAAQIGFSLTEWTDTPSWPPVMTRRSILEYIIAKQWNDDIIAIGNDDEIFTRMTDFVYPEYFSNLAGIMPSIPADFLSHQSFVEYLLVSPHSFFIVIDNPSIYKREYPLVTGMGTSHFTTRSKDTPRGLLFVNGHKIVPYAISSGHYEHWHVMMTDYYMPYSDLYETNPHRTAVPSPMFDKPDMRKQYSASMLELYA